MEVTVQTWSQMDETTKTRLLARSEQGIESILDPVAEIVAAVRQNGDAALRDFTKRFDKVDLGETPLNVQPEEFEEGIHSLPGDVKAAIDYAVANVRAVHEYQRPEPLQMREIRPGVTCGERAIPIDSVGLYVPRGRGSFPSMLYMLAVPAAIAGVPRIVLATPPDQSGRVDPACLYAARLCGVTQIVRVGGAQAIAAFAYGTESVDAVMKIVGPGSAYVAAAKRIVRDDVDVGLPAGPSESMIVADASADVATVARDLLLEAEHGADSQAVLVTTNRPLAEAVAAELPTLVENTPEPRRSFLQSVFGNYGGVILARDLAEATEVVNAFAPEHLQVRVEDTARFLAGIRNAAEILLGRDTPFSLANYAIGGNAVLPTGGAAKVHSGVSVRDFLKTVAVMEVSADGYEEIAGHTATLARYEGFHWHEHALYDRSPNRADGK